VVDGAVFRLQLARREMANDNAPTSGIIDDLIVVDGKLMEELLAIALR